LKGNKKPTASAVGFFITESYFSCVILRAKPLPAGRQVKDPMPTNKRLSLLCVGFFANAQNDNFHFVILNAVKDPMAFSNNQQSLLCVGFFANAQNDNHTRHPERSEGSHGFQ